MVWVPGGTFEMGDDVYPEEGPLRTVTVKGFWIDRNEVTNAEFGEFVSATGYVTLAERTGARDARNGAAVFVVPGTNADLSTPAAWWHERQDADWRHPGGGDTSIAGRDHFPVVALALADVEAYAKWKGRDLPTEAEWEWAARAGAPHTDDRPPAKSANTWQGVFPIIDSADDGFAGVAPVGCYSANAFGLHDMIGNVWEWTADTYEAEPNARVIKGGSYLCASNYCLRYRPGARQGQADDLPSSHLGFRTVLHGPGPSEAQGSLQSAFGNDYADHVIRSGQSRHRSRTPRRQLIRRVAMPGTRPNRQLLAAWQADRGEYHRGPA
jgi:formylglycine-generating enzyme required for sulfatase activity